MLERVVRGLQARKGTWREIAAACGVSYSWLTKVAQGHIKNPSIKQLEAVDSYLRAAA
jgi:transcriptional regulator with XRE-family HTH domain